MEFVSSGLGCSDEARVRQEFGQWGTAGYAVVPDYTAKATPMIDVSMITMDCAAAMSVPAPAADFSAAGAVEGMGPLSLSMSSGAVMLPMPEGSTGRLSSACPVSVAT